LMADSQAKHDTAVEGTQVGQYPAGSKALLQTAIDKAMAVADNPAATQQQVEQAAAELNAALIEFQASVNKPIPGDTNNDSRVTVGDLGIIASAYGKTSADPDWAQFMKADINRDGKVDIEDLAAVARKILGS
jgi:hypothetical protein